MKDAAKEQLAAVTVAALKQHVPFDAMDWDSLRYLASRLAVAYYPRGARVAGGPADRLHIVKAGRVQGGTETVEPGECFPVGALVAKRDAPEYRAEADTFCWELPAAAFEALLERSERFRAFCTNRLAVLLDEAHRAQLAGAAQALADGAGLLAPLRSALSRAAVSCPPATPVREVLAAMRREGIGSMVVADASARPVGIFTTQDVLDRVAAPQASVDAPISGLMTPSPVALEQEAPLIEAAVAMVRHRIRHVVVTRDGALAGVVSERDLFALQRLSLRRVAERIGAAAPGEMREAADDIRRLTRQLLAQGVAVGQLTPMVSALNDLLSQRIIALAAERHAVPGAWCWLALGSEGRLEQTFVTDQDNALIFVPEGDVAAARRTFLSFGKDVNNALDAAGFPLCKGDIMAGNPRWCLDPHEWREVFAAWIRNPLPEALLNANIFFDFRALAGEARLAGTLREAVLSLARANPAFCRAMAHNALVVRPPLGLLRDFAAEDGVLDLKLYGSRPFVDAARVLALAEGIVETATAARLRAVREGAAVEAFQFIQGLRLRTQDNRVRVDALSSLERRMLKEAFRIAVALQDRLRADYP